MIDRPSPNHGPRPDGVPIDLVVLHYTGMISADAALERMCDPAAEVSAHYLIDEDGSVCRLVAEDRRAWHAGVASWDGQTGINDRSIGIELVNPGHEFGYRPFPEPQIEALEHLLGDILARHRIQPLGVIGHSDVAPSRKQDPGELFPWRRLAARGLAIWPDAEASAAPPDAQRAAILLKQIGYGLDPEPPALAGVLTAFQRRFRPALCDGRLDPETMGLIEAVRDLSN